MISRDLDIHNLINASSVIITRISNMGLESMILKKPVVIFDTFFHTSDYFGYTEFGASLHAKKQGDLGECLFKILYEKNIQNKLQKNMKKFISRNYSVNDGKSSVRLSRLIDSMI